jgi:hypothetical protein
MSIVNGKTESHLDMLDNMVIERLLNDKWSSFARVRSGRFSLLIFVRLFQVNFVRQLILLCLHLFFFSTAVFLRDPKGGQPLPKRIFCYIAEVCVLIGCLISIFTLVAKEIYLQGFNYYVQNLVRARRSSFKCFEMFFVVVEKLPREILVSVLVHPDPSGSAFPGTLFNHE